jgi:hypothetical protein
MVRRSYKIVAVCVALSISAFFVARAQTIPAPKSAEAVYKNIQVLKGIPTDRLIPAMQFITASLGVECGFCHVENHFDQDDKKPKQTARKMMQMVMAINRNNFDAHREVTCNSCHRGSRTPAAIPAISEAPAAHLATTEDEGLPPNLPTADQLLEKYAQAQGGANAIEKISSRYEKGTIRLFGRDVDVEIFDKTPDKRISITHLPDGDSATAFDGHEGWLSAPHRAVREMPASEAVGARLDADLQMSLHLKQVFGDLKPARPEKIGDHETYQLAGERSGQPTGRLYFDQQSGLLVRMIRYSDSPLGLNPMRIDYSDYRAVAGVQVPFRWTIARPAGQFTIQVSSIQQNVPIDDAKFAKPTATGEVGQK